jgi:hypothetical protein
VIGHVDGVFFLIWVLFISLEQHVLKEMSRAVERSWVEATTNVDIEGSSAFVRLCILNEEASQAIL